MIARSGRLAGAILLESDGRFFLVGNTKEPCDWPDAGFAAPEKPAGTTTRVQSLNPLRPVPIQPPYLIFHWGDKTPESLAELLANRFLIQRNSSVSERLWRLVTGENDEQSHHVPEELDASWLVHMPEPVWNIVREAVLKCM